MKLATPISLDRLCQLALVSRAGFYRWQTPSPEADPDPDRAGVSLLRLAAHHRGTEEARLAGQSQACLPDHARG
jgi:hypothetical protein